MNGRKVVVTGLGLITPVGNDVETAWSALKNGVSGINTISHFDTSTFSTRFGGSIKNFDCSLYMDSKDARRFDIFIQYGIAAGVQAYGDSGIEASQSNPERFGVAIGSGIGGITSIEETSLQISKTGHWHRRNQPDRCKADCWLLQSPAPLNASSRSTDNKYRPSLSHHSPLSRSRYHSRDRHR